MKEKRNQTAPFRSASLFSKSILFALILLAGACGNVWATPAPGPWTPMFKGVDHAVGTNVPGLPGSFPVLQVAHCVRVDLTDPDVQLLTTPRAKGYQVESRETVSQAVPTFLRTNRLQIAADAGFYSANPGGSDPTSEGVSCEVFGLQISAGTVVSPTASESNPRFASLLFTTNNQPSVLFHNIPPGTNTAGIYTVITGFYPVLSNGVNFSAEAAISYPDSGIHSYQPRTVFGVSRDSRYLYLMTIDGRQPGYSEGALDEQSADWMLLFGAWNAINMDGGGSTSLYTGDSLGKPVAINHSSYLAAYGHERYIGSHFGIAAKPLPHVIKDLVAIPDDLTALITWTTVTPATSQVSYGLTTALKNTSSLSMSLETNHSVLLTGLTPGTDYYFSALSEIDGVAYPSPLNLFTTSNYVVSGSLFDLNKVWKYTVANLDGVNWTAPGYADSGWTGAGAGVLWADTRGAPAAGLPSPTTQMPVPSGSSGAYRTYYFRTHFNFTNAVSGAAMQFQDYVDDGAVFYLNGVETYRQRMPAAPALISNATLASAYPCAGNATCSDDFSLSGLVVATNLLSGDNVLAVEVHNYNASSPDITFGLALNYTVPSKRGATLNIAVADGTITVTWNGNGFTLQHASAPEGSWADVPGPVQTSPYTTTTDTGSKRFFRLR